MEQLDGFLPKCFLEMQPRLIFVYHNLATQEINKQKLCSTREQKQSTRSSSEQMQQMQGRPNATLPQSSLCKGTKQTFVYFHPLWKFFIIIMFIIIMFIIETFCFCQNVKEFVSPSYKLSTELLYFHPCYLFSEEWCVIMITWVF